jgi:hypothetical protein
MWVDGSSPGCGTISESTGKIRLSKPVGCVGFAIARFGTSVLCGDFDVQIDYELAFPAASSAGGSIHGIQLRVTGTDQLVAGAERYRQGSSSCVWPQADSYKFYTTVSGCPPDAIYIAGSDSAGKFRISRHGMMVQAYYWDGMGWVLGLNRTITSADLYLQLNSGTNGSYTAATSGTFDNLIVQSAQCLTDLSDDFNDGVLDSIWAPEASCGSPSVFGGELHLAKDAGCTGGPSVTLDPLARIIRGDFEVWVSFSLPVFPIPPVQNPAGARWFSLEIHRASDLSTGTFLAAIQRYNRQVGDCAPYGDNYKAFTTNPLNCVSSWANAEGGASGKLRISRIGTMFRMFYWNQTAHNWVELRSENGPTDDVVVRLNSCTGVDTGAHDGRFDDLNILVNDVTAVTDGKTPRSKPVLTLGPSYPNPFNPVTRIPFQLAEQREATIAVYTVGGAFVKTLTRGVRPAGTYYVTWDGRDEKGVPVGSGIYFVRMKSGQTVVNAKIVLLK